MKQKHPQPVAYCWNYSREMSRRDIAEKGCTDWKKQSRGVCKHLQMYGEGRQDVRRMTMQELYESIRDTLEQHGVRLVGSRISLLQEMPGGGRMRLGFDDAEKVRLKRQEAYKPPCGGE
jgi:hypothetical protein